MIDTTVQNNLQLVKKQSSGSPALYMTKQKTIGFTTELVGSKHVHKEGTFKIGNKNDG
jgi:hypothetical protein